MGRRTEHLEIQKAGFPASPGRTVARPWFRGVVRPGRLSGYPHVNHHHSLSQGGEKNQNQIKITIAGSTTRIRSWQRRREVISIFPPTPFFCSPSGQRQAPPGGECPKFGTVVPGRPARPGLPGPRPPPPQRAREGRARHSPAPGALRRGPAREAPGGAGARGRRGGGGGDTQGRDLNRGEVSVKRAAGAAVPGSIPCRRGGPGRRPSWGGWAGSAGGGEDVTRWQVRPASPVPGEGGRGSPGSAARPHTALTALPWLTHGSWSQGGTARAGAGGAPRPPPANGAPRPGGLTGQAANRNAGRPPAAERPVRPSESSEDTPPPSAGEGWGEPRRAGPAPWPGQRPISSEGQVDGRRGWPIESARGRGGETVTQGAGAVAAGGGTSAGEAGPAPPRPRGGAGLAPEPPAAREVAGADRGWPRRRQGRFPREEGERSRGLVRGKPGRPRWRLWKAWGGGWENLGFPRDIAVWKWEAGGCLCLTGVTVQALDCFLILTFLKNKVQPRIRHGIRICPGEWKKWEQ